MKNLTAIWGDFSKIPLQKEVYVTKRLFLQKLDDPDKNDPPLYLGVNTLSGSIDIFTNKEGELLKTIIDTGKICDDAGKNSNFFSQLLNRGYLFPSQELEEITFQSILNNYKILKTKQDKMLMFISLDMSCNMGCSYCFQGTHGQNSKEIEMSKMDSDSIKSSFKAIDLIQSLNQKKVSWVAGYGGEPLQKGSHDINELFISLAKQRGLPIVYFSNLAMLDSDLLSLLKSNAKYISFISTTLDGVDSKHNVLRKYPNSFNQTVDNIDILLQSGIHVTVRTNIDLTNINNLIELADFYEKKGWFDYPNFKAFTSKIIDRHHTVKGIDREDEIMSKLLDLKEKYTNIRKINSYKVAYSLENILRAVKLRETVGGIGHLEEESGKVNISPLINYCPVDNGSEYVFTGQPYNSIYACAESAPFLKYRLGTHYPMLKMESNNYKYWNGNYLNTQRIIDNLQCKNCCASTFCGGGCSFEAITKNGCRCNVCCKDVPSIIRSFLKNESKRLYYRCRALLEMCY